MKSILFNRHLKPVWGDDREVTLVNRGILERKPILRRLIQSYYEEMLAMRVPGPALELGAGGGFMKVLAADVITSDMFPVPGLDLVCDGTALPFADGSLRNILLRGVLHHIHDPITFFEECRRVLAVGGRIIINDPVITPFSYLINRFVHFEYCDPNADWRFKRGQPLMDCNLAMASIIFERKSDEFRRLFPEFEIIHTRRHDFMLYLLTGGYSFPALIPNWAFPLAQGVEWILSPLHSLLANIIFIVIEKKAQAVTRSSGQRGTLAS